MAISQQILTIPYIRSIYFANRSNLNFVAIKTGSLRLQGWDYGSKGDYFITIVTKNRLQWFGKVENGIMNLSELGKTAHDEWLRTVGLRPEMNISLGNFVVMPDHFHAIISKGENPHNRIPKLQYKNSFTPQSNNLGSIIRGFKSSVTMAARLAGNKQFGWQSLYHDHIIRNEKEYSRISLYIAENPRKWSTH